MSRLLVPLVFLSGLVAAQGVNPRWIVDPLPASAFLPPLDEDGTSLVVAAAPGEVRSSPLEIGLVTGFTFLGKVRERGGGSLRIAFGADPWRSRGYEVDLGVPGGEVVLFRLNPAGATRVGAAARPPAADGGWSSVRVRVTGSSLQVSIEGVNVKPRGGWRMGSAAEGRLLLGAAGGLVRIASPRLEAWLAAKTLSRIRLEQGREPVPELPEARAIPLQGPLDLVPRDDLVRGLGDEDAGLVEGIRRRATAGEVSIALRQAEGVRRRCPDAAGAAFLVGAIRMLDATNVAAAIGPLRAAGELPGARALLGDALWSIGDLGGADRAFTAAGDLGGQALVAWARGDARRAAGLVRGGEAKGCRAAGRRLRLVEDLMLLQAADGLHDASAEELSVRSDLDASRAQRVLRTALTFLEACRGWLPGKADPRQLTILACGSRATYARWNSRLGGARFVEADGIYRPGTGFLVVLDDDDDGVLRRRVQHEVVHHVVWERGWALPRPLEEGLAEMLAQAPPGRIAAALKKLVPGRFPLARDLAREGRLEPPVTVLMRDDLREGDRGREDYAQAWAALWTLAGRKDDGLERVLRLAGDPGRRAELRQVLPGLVSQRAVAARLLEAR